MAATQSATILASLRDQLIDVSIGILTPQAWLDRVEAAQEQGVEVPAELIRSVPTVTCPACGQLLTVTDGFTECGGEGEGGCDESCEGSARCVEANERAVALASGTHV